MKNKIRAFDEIKNKDTIEFAYHEVSIFLQDLLVKVKLQKCSNLCKWSTCVKHDRD